VFRCSSRDALQAKGTTPADFFRGAHEGDPVFCGECRRSVVVVELHVDVHGAGLLLRLDQSGELGRVVGGDEAEQMLQSVVLGVTTVVGRERGGDTVESGGGDRLDFSFERPLPGRRGVSDERPEVGDVGDGGHG
jgi:hypothetical protein